MWMPYAQYKRSGWTESEPAVPASKYWTDLRKHTRGKAMHNLRWGFPVHAAADPQWLENFMRLNGPYLYHGTTAHAAKSILRDGLYPHDDPELAGPEEYDEWGDAVPASHSDYDPYMRPRPNHVYLGTPKFINQMGYGAGKPGQGGRQVLKVDLRKLKPENLNADEDHFGVNSYPHPIRDQVWGEYPPPEPGGEEGLGDWADYVNLGQDPEETHYSMGNGSVAHNGHIPPSAISLASPEEFDSWKPQEPAHAGWDLTQDPGAPVLAKTDANHFEARMFHHSDKGLLREIKPPFLVSDQKHPTLVNHEVSITFRHPFHVFVPLMQAHVDAAQDLGADGIVSHTPQGMQALALDPGTVVPGHEHDFPY